MLSSALESTTQADSLWQSLAAEVIAGHSLNRDQALSILRTTDDELLDLVGGAFKIRHRYFGKTVQLYFLMNAKRIATTAANPKFRTLPSPSTTF
jgi:biotin synthase-like enzyme